MAAEPLIHASPAELASGRYAAGRSGVGIRAKDRARSRWFTLALAITLLIDIPCSFLIPVGWDVSSTGAMEWRFLFQFEAKALFSGEMDLGPALVILVHTLVCGALLVLGVRSAIRFVEETY